MNRFVVAAAVACSFTVCGCSTLSEFSAMSEPAAHCGPAHGMELIVGAHRHAPAPTLDARLACRVGDAIRDGKPVSIVVADGRPFVITPRLLSVTGGTLAQQDSPRVRTAIPIIRCCAGMSMTHAAATSGATR